MWMMPLHWHVNQKSDDDDDDDDDDHDDDDDDDDDDEAGPKTVQTIINCEYNGDVYCELKTNIENDSNFLCLYINHVYQPTYLIPMLTDF